MQTHARYRDCLTSVRVTSGASSNGALVASSANQKRGKLVDFLNGPLYPSAEVRAALRDITSGNNGAYKAQAGWDACTGLGVPDGQKPIDALKGS